MENSKEEDANLNSQKPPYRNKEEKGNQKYESKIIIIKELEKLLKNIKKKRKIDNLNLLSIWNPYIIITLAYIFFLFYTLNGTDVI